MLHFTKIVFRFKKTPTAEDFNIVKQIIRLSSSDSGQEGPPTIKPFEPPEKDWMTQLLETQKILKKQEKASIKRLADAAKYAKELDPKPIEVTSKKASAKVQFNSFDWKPTVEGINIDQAAFRRLGTMTAGNVKFTGKIGTDGIFQIITNVEMNAFKHIVDYGTVPKIQFFNFTGDLSVKKIGQQPGQKTRSFGLGIGMPPQTDEGDDRVAKKIFANVEQTDPRTGEGSARKLVIEDLRSLGDLDKTTAEIIEGFLNGTVVPSFSDVKYVLKSLLSYEATSIPRAKAFVNLLEAARKELQRFLKENEQAHQEFLVENGVSSITGEGTDEVVLFDDIMKDFLSGLNMRIATLRKTQKPETEFDNFGMAWLKEFYQYMGWALKIEDLDPVRRE